MLGLRQLPSPLLILGPAYAGKSELAHAGLYPDRDALVLGTGDLEDPGLARRIQSLKDLRPPSWRTIEPVRDVPAALAEALMGTGQPASPLRGDSHRREASGIQQVLIDSIGQWIAGQCVENTPYAGEEELEERIAGGVGELVRMIESLPRVAPATRLVLVTAEAGGGPSPSRAIERLFRRAMGDANRRLARICPSVVLVQAGIATILKGSLP